VAMVINSGGAKGNMGERKGIRSKGSINIRRSGEAIHVKELSRFRDKSSRSTVAGHIVGLSNRQTWGHCGSTYETYRARLALRVWHLLGHDAVEMC